MRSQVCDSGLREQRHLGAHAGVERSRVALSSVIDLRHTVESGEPRSGMVPRSLDEANADIVEHLRGGQLVEVVRPAICRQGNDQVGIAVACRPRQGKGTRATRKRQRRIAVAHSIGGEEGAGARQHQRRRIQQRIVTITGRAVLLELTKGTPIDALPLGVDDVKDDAPRGLVLSAAGRRNASRKVSRAAAEEQQHAGARNPCNPSDHGKNDTT